jgi:hypothetical protein
LTDERLILENAFAAAPLIRSPAEQLRPSFWGKLKLLFSKKFEVRAGGHSVKSTFRGKFKAIFSKEFVVRKEGVIIGRGLFESQLEQLGYAKKELKKLVESGALDLKTTRYQGGWRNTYVLLPSQEKGATQ